MSYAIIRNANYKKNNLAGLYKHNERKNTNYSNKDINKNASIKNYSLKQCNTTYLNAIKQLIAENNLQCRITSYTNLACEFIITSDKEFFENIGEKETKRYFETAYNFVANYKGLGEKYILSAKVHMDETTPHLHLVFVPVVHTKDKNGKQIDKIACSTYWKGKDSYRILQDKFYKYVTDNRFDLERGKAIEAEHLSVEKFKQITEYENIQQELIEKPIQEIETKNTSLIIAQNKALIKYNKKLKNYLLKSFKAIQKVEELQEENNILKNENKKLEEKNYQLNNYIENTFRVIKLLFNFPKNKLKRLIDNFIKSK